MDLADIVKSCGVVGAGGAGFPTHVKLGSRVDTVVVNGAECEPLLAGDTYLLEREGGTVIQGLRLVMEACGARRGFIAVKEKHREALDALAAQVQGNGDIRLFPLGDFYPAGDEFVLVHEVTGRVVPPGGIPPQVGCLVENVETTVNVCRAVQEGTPVTRRVLTCTGEVRRPSVVVAHVGTPVREIIELCGGATEQECAVILGGPLMGTVETDLDTPVTKTTGGVILLPRDHPLVQRKTLPLETVVRRSRTACCQCTYCTELCPRYLLGHDLQPHLIMRQLGLGGELDPKLTGVIEAAALCSGCGLCEAYACVMGLSPGMVNARIKAGMSEAGHRPVFPESGGTVNPMREYRKVPAGRITDRLQLAAYARRPLRRGVRTDPSMVELPLKQHIGAPAEPVVRPGDRVVEGGLLARVPEGALGAAVHASISGEVSLVDGERIILAGC